MYACVPRRSAGQSHDATSAAFAVFQGCERHARALGNALHGTIDEVEACAHHVRDTLKELRTFQDDNSLAAPQTDAAGAAGPSAAAPVVVRRLSDAASGTPSTDELLQQSGDLANRAGDARNGVLGRLAHLDALNHTGSQAPPPLPAALYTAPPSAEPGTVTPDGTKETIPPSGTTPGTGTDGDSKNEGRAQNLYLAIGITGGIFLLVGLSCYGVYAHRKRARRLNSLKQADSMTIQHQITHGEAQGEPPFFTPTLDFDEIFEGGQDAQPVDMSQAPEEYANGELGGVAVVLTADPFMGVLETGKADTTQGQYLIGGHHLMARELSSTQTERCRTPLAYVFSSAPTDMRPPRAGFATPGVRTPREWDSEHTGASARGRSSSPTMRHYQQELRREQSRRTQEYENLEAEVERELQTQRQREVSTES